jgi:hypothetical protein
MAAECASQDVTRMAQLFGGVDVGLLHASAGPGL